MADQALRHIIRAGLGSGYEVMRADEDENPGAITPRMIASIMSADLVIADLTNHNPNVFYEVAIAHGFSKPTVHMQRALESVAFDIKDMRIIRYDLTDPDDVERARKTLSAYARSAVTESEPPETPISAAGRFLNVATSRDPVAESNVQVIAAITDLRREILQLMPVRARVPRIQQDDYVRGQEAADVQALKRFMDRIIETNRAESKDFQSLLTPDTSASFDRWILERLRRVVEEDQDDDQNLMEIAANDELLGNMYQGGDNDDH